MCMKGYKTGAAVGAYRFVKFSAADTVVQAAASTDLIIGASDLAGASGDTIDVAFDGIHKLILGGTVARGKKLTADSDGKAVEAAPSTGVNAQTGALALQSGVSGDIIDALIVPGSVQG